MSNLTSCPTWTLWSLSETLDEQVVSLSLSLSLPLISVFSLFFQKEEEALSFANASMSAGENKPQFETQCTQSDKASTSHTCCPDLNHAGIKWWTNSPNWTLHVSDSIRIGRSNICFVHWHYIYIYMYIHMRVKSKVCFCIWRSGTSKRIKNNNYSIGVSNAF